VTEILERRVGDRLHVIDPWAPNAKQNAFFRAAAEPWPVKEILFDGSVRGGKTQACCRLIVAWAMKFRGAYLIGRSTYKELEDSTKRVMLRGEGGLPPACPDQLIAEKFEGDKNKIVLRNSSEIMFRSLEPDRRGTIRNLTLAGAFIDQVEELDDDESDEEFYDELVGRLSERNAPRKMLLAANPGPETHWIARRFGCTDDADAERSPQLRAKTRRVHVTILDNKDYLDPELLADYLATQHTRPDYYERMVLGNWGAFGGKRFKCWNAHVNVVPKVFDIPDDWEIVEGLDYGYAHPFGKVWFAIDFQGAWWAIAEHNAKEMRLSQHAKLIQKVRANDQDDEIQRLRPFAGDLSPSASYLGPDAWAPRGEHAAPANELFSYGIYPSKAWNERIGGWNRLEEMLTEIMEDGYSRLRFFPTLKVLPTQIRSAKIKTGTDDIEKVNDDVLDACRYAAMTRLGPPVREESAEDPHSREAVARRAMTRVRERDYEVEEVY
jgi:PBSX family phage terminase large subunit